MRLSFRLQSRAVNLLLFWSILVSLYLLLSRLEVLNIMSQFGIFKTEPTRASYNVTANISIQNVTSRYEHIINRLQIDYIRFKVVHNTKAPTPRMPENSFCDAKSRWADNAIHYKTNTSMADWTFQKRRTCPEFKLGGNSEKRQQIVLHCQTNNSYMIPVSRDRSDRIEQIQFGDRCLVDVIDRCCYDQNKVPNVAHLVWYGNDSVDFFQYLTFMSLQRFMKPCLILIHGPSIPVGKYWDSFISTTPNVIHVRRERPDSVYGHRLAYPEHASDIMRIEALQKYGGVYVDFDEVLLRPIEPLRKYEYTQGHELNVTLGSQLILAKKNATFLTHWHQSYRDDSKKSRDYNALSVPWNIARRHPELINVEGYNFTRPSWKNMKLIHDTNYNWSTNYGMHLVFRYYRRAINIDIIRTLNTTVGSISRHILLGDKALCVK